MITVSTPANLDSLRDDARTLLNEFDAADGLATYYTLHHKPERTMLVVHHNDNGKADGFVVRCQTGIDLFRPVVTMRLRGNGDVAELLDQALQPGRPYILVVPASLQDRVESHLELTDITHNQILRLDPNRYHPEINVLVSTRVDEAGHPRAEILQQGKVAAVAGINWRTPIFAEIFVHVQPERRQRGWGRAVVNALVGELIKQQITPLYSVDEENDISLELASSVGFVDTGAREITAQAIRITVDVPQD